MSKFLFKASYTVEGVKGLRRAGGSSRRDAVAKAAESVGGRLERFYFAFGDHDAFVIADLPDNQSAAAFALAGERGGRRGRTHGGAPDAGRSRRRGEALDRLPAPSGVGGTAPLLTRPRYRPFRQVRQRAESGASTSNRISFAVPAAARWGSIPAP